HCQWCLELAELAEPHLQSEDQAEWLDVLECEHDNFRAALKWCVDSEMRLRLASALHRFWLVRAHLKEGLSWLTGSLNRAHGAPAPLLGKALNTTGILAWAEGDYGEAER